MNRLSEFILRREMDTTEAMNVLQGGGVVSDNCVTAEDVAEVDCQRAVNFLIDYLEGPPKPRKCPICGVPVERCCC
jgi:hypothetical protein